MEVMLLTEVVHTMAEVMEVQTARQDA